MSTIKSFVSQSYVPETLIRAVVRQAGSWSEFKNIAADVARYGASGGFSGFIYYSDTVKFAKKHKTEILALAKAFADEVDCGVFDLIGGFNCLRLSADVVAEALYDPRSDERNNVYNALAWFALEEVARSYDDLTD